MGEGGRKERRKEGGREKGEGKGGRFSSPSLLLPPSLLPLIPSLLSSLPPDPSPFPPVSIRPVSSDPGQSERLLCAVCLLYLRNTFYNTVK